MEITEENWHLLDHYQIGSNDYISVERKCPHCGMFLNAQRGKMNIKQIKIGELFQRKPIFSNYICKKHGQVQPFWLVTCS